VTKVNIKLFCELLFNLFIFYSNCNYYCKRYQIPAASLLNHNLLIDIFIRNI